MRKRKLSIEEAQENVDQFDIKVGNQLTNTGRSDIAYVERRLGEFGKEYILDFHEVKIKFIEVERDNAELKKSQENLQKRVEKIDKEMELQRFIIRFFRYIKVMVKSDWFGLFAKLYLTIDAIRRVFNFFN